MIEPKVIKYIECRQALEEILRLICMCKNYCNQPYSSSYTNDRTWYSFYHVDIQQVNYIAGTRNTASHNLYEQATHNIFLKKDYIRAIFISILKNHGFKDMMAFAQATSNMCYYPASAPQYFTKLEQILYELYSVMKEYTDLMAKEEDIKNVITGLKTVNDVKTPVVQRTIPKELTVV